MGRRSYAREEMNWPSRYRAVAMAFLLALSVQVSGRAQAAGCINSNANVNQTGICIDTFKPIGEARFKPIGETRSPAELEIGNRPYTGLFAHWFLVGNAAATAASQGNPRGSAYFNVQFSITSLGTVAPQAQGAISGGGFSGTGTVLGTASGGEISASASLDNMLSVWQLAGSPYGITVCWMGWSTCDGTTTASATLSLPAPPPPYPAPCRNSDDNIRQSYICIDTFSLVQEPAPQVSARSGNVPTVTLAAHWFLVNGRVVTGATFGAQFTVTSSGQVVSHPVRKITGIAVGGQISAGAVLHHVPDVWGVSGSPFQAIVVLDCIDNQCPPPATATLSQPAPLCPAGTHPQNGQCVK